MPCNMTQTGKRWGPQRRGRDLAEADVNVRESLWELKGEEEAHTSELQIYQPFQELSRETSQAWGSLTRQQASGASLERWASPSQLAGWRDLLCSCSASISPARSPVSQRAVRLCSGRGHSSARLPLVYRHRPSGGRALGRRQGRWYSEPPDSPSSEGKTAYSNQKGVLGCKDCSSTDNLGTFQSFKQSNEKAHYRDIHRKQWT